MFLSFSGRPRENEAGRAYVLALGFFDGLHLGHRALLKETVRQASLSGAVPALLAFSDPKGTVKAPSRLYPEEQLPLQAALCGISRVFTLPMESVRTMDPETFFLSLSETLPLAGVVCGFNYRFGKNAIGDTEVLRALCLAAGITCTVTDPVLYGGQPISTTRIREALRAGKVQPAADMLGRPYSFTSVSCPGHQLGRTLGVPTINQPLPSSDILRPGVYISRCRIDGIRREALTDIGDHPSVPDGGGIHSETHLLCTADVPYGTEVEVELLAYLREEICFSSREALVAQIRKDLEKGKAFFGKESL